MRAFAAYSSQNVIDWTQLVSLSVDIKDLTIERQ